jgi:hypothetical protein
VQRCSICGRRAVYRRTYSGELLCERCLLRVLAKSVKRQASRSGGFRPRMDVLVPIGLWRPYLGLALTLALHEATSNLDVHLHAVMPAGDGWEVVVHEGSLARLEALERVTLWRARLRLKRLPDSLRACIRLERAWAVRAAKLVGAQAVALPITRTAAVLEALDTLFRGEAWGLSEAKEESVVIDGIVVAPLFYSVECEVPSALAAALGLYAWSPCKVKVLASEVVARILQGRPELAFSPLKSLRLLLSPLESMERCPMCGGFTPRPGICPDCELVGLDGVDVEELGQG